MTKNKSLESGTMKIKLCLGLIVSVVLLSGCSSLAEAAGTGTIWYEGIGAETAEFTTLTIGDDLDMANHKIINLANGTTSADAVNVSQLTANTATIWPNANLSSTSNQTSGGTTVANNVTFNSNDQLIQITHSTSTNTSQIWTQSSGAYLVTFSAVVYASAVNKHVDIWFAKNGVNVSNSNTHYELPLSGESLVTVTTIMQLAQADYIELKWASTDDASMKLLATPAGTSPTRPASPSVILTINKVSN